MHDLRRALAVLFEVACDLIGIDPSALGTSTSELSFEGIHHPIGRSTLRSTLR